MARRSKSCHAGTVRFKTKRGKVVSFKGHTGAGCGPRPKPRTGHLSVYKKGLARAARACKGKSLHAFRNCVASNMPRHPRRARG
jgi:hypothetical protein